MVKRRWKIRLVLVLLTLGALSVIPACAVPEAANNILFENTLMELVAGSPIPADFNPDDCIVLGEPDTDTHQQVFDALNDYRFKQGLNPLVYSKRLEAAANAHVRDMAERGYFAHITPEGLHPTDRALEAGFCHKYIGENLAAGQQTVTRVMEAWDESPDHQRNLVEPDFVYAGIGYYQDSTGRRFWAQLFAFDYNE